LLLCVDRSAQAPSRHLHHTLHLISIITICK